MSGYCSVNASEQHELKLLGLVLERVNDMDPAYLIELIQIAKKAAGKSALRDLTIRDLEHAIDQVLS